MEIFRQLGLLVEDRWRARNYSEGAFPELAAAALAEVGLPEKGVAPWDIVRWSHTEPQLPRQQDIDARFGNPPITLYCGSRFYIDIYFWLDGTTDIHQHSFAGAFQVLTGSSIHSRYSFQREETVNESLLLGSVVLDDVELLSAGDIRQIISGSEFIHALFHLDRPSCTITVRTFGAPSKQPQYSYRKPFIAVDPFYTEPSLVRKLQTVGMLLHLQTAEYDGLIGDLIAGSDFQTTFLVLQTAFRMLNDNQMERFFQVSNSRDRFASLMDQARRKHGRLMDYVPSVLNEESRQNDIVRGRGILTSPEHRFFLALLLNVSNRARILKLVEQRFPGSNAIDKVLDWVMELATTKVWGAADANVLGLNDFDDDHLFVLQCLLEGLSEQQVTESLNQSYPPEHARMLEGRLVAIAASLQASSFFKAMLNDVGQSGSVFETTKM
jgi:hypothetical protein